MSLMERYFAPPACLASYAEHRAGKRVLVKEVKYRPVPAYA
jgi:hypothetical protein